MLIIYFYQNNMKTLNNFYTDGEYLKNNPTWDSEDAPWKAKQLFSLVSKNIKNFKDFKKISEVGCGSGEVLVNFSKLVNSPDVKYFGYDLSPDAIKIAEGNKSFNKNNFEYKVLSIPDNFSSLTICADVFEHIEDPFSFLRDLKKTSEYFVFNIPLDLSVQSMMREHVILAQRKRVGHVNYYTKNLALETLRDTGYEIADYAYGKWYKHVPSSGLSTKIISMFRNILMPICPEICVQYLGGSSLIVLAK